LAGYFSQTVQHSAATELSHVIDANSLVTVPEPCGRPKSERASEPACFRCPRGRQLDASLTLPTTGYPGSWHLQCSAARYRQLVGGSDCARANTGHRRSIGARRPPNSYEGAGVNRISVSRTCGSGSALDPYRGSNGCRDSLYVEKE